MVGSGLSRQAYRPLSTHVSCLIPAFLSDYSSKVNAVPRPDRSRTALVDAAATLFRRQGYAATGLNQILAEAGVRPGSLYHHFPQGKQQLAAAVVDGSGAAIAQLLRRMLAKDMSVADIIDRWVDFQIAGLAADWRDGCPIEPIATESVHASELVREASARAFDGWCAAIEKRLRQDGWPPADAKSAAVAVISQMEGALMLARVSGATTPLEVAKSAVRQLLRR
jgi:TetR/AcrR family transcriptional regulator, lmrAB and yxaGH operons repressor